MVNFLFLVLSLMPSNNVKQGALVWDIPMEDLKVYSRYQFFLNLPTMAVADDGTVVVLDFKERQLAFINPDGSLGKRVGNRGQGPREFGGFEAIRWLPDRRAFAVIDRGNSRLTLWDTKGKLIHSQGLRDTLRKPSFLDGERVIYLEGHDMFLGATPKLVMYNITNGKSAEVWKMNPLKIASGYHGTDSSGSESFAVDFNATVHFAVASQTAIVNYGVSSELKLIDLETGKMKRSFDAKVAGVPMTDAYYSYIYENMDQYTKRDVNEKLGGKPDFWPYFSRILSGPEGNFWLFSFQTELEGPSPYIVVSPTGDVINRGKVPGGPLAVTKDAFYVVRCDSEGESIKLVKLSRDH